MSQPPRVARQPKSSARKGKPRGRPFPKGNPWAWKPGQSGNPAGRTPLVRIGEAYSKILGIPIPDDPMERTYAEAIAQKVAELALKGNLFAVEEIADRTEGKPRQPVEHSGPDGGPIVIEQAIREQAEKELIEWRLRQIEQLNSQSASLTRPISPTSTG